MAYSVEDTVKLVLVGALNTVDCKTNIEFVFQPWCNEVLPLSVLLINMFKNTEVFCQKPCTLVVIYQVSEDYGTSIFKMENEERHRKVFEKIDSFLPKHTQSQSKAQ
jgi:hypothetical protein